MINEKDEKFLKEEINKYMNEIKIPENLEGIIMEDINKVKKEQKKKMSKTKKIIAGAASFVIIAGAVSAFAFKDVLFNKNQGATSVDGTNTEVPMAQPEDENKINLGDLNINIEDQNLYAVGFRNMAVIQNGEVYFGYQYTPEGNEEINVRFKKVSGITDAVSIGAYALATDVSKTFLVTTEEGTLYRIWSDGEAHKYLEDYKIATIISAQGEENHEYVVVLKDNRKVKISDKLIDENGNYIGERIITSEDLGAYENVNISGNKGNKQSGNSLYAEGYMVSSFIVNGNVYTTSIDTESTIDNISTVTKQNNLNDVKSVKGHVLGTDPTTTFFAIKNNGEVYSFGNGEVSKVDYMKDYKVDDIVNVKYSGVDKNNALVHSFELKLKDGSSVVVYNGEDYDPSTVVSAEEIADIQEFLNKIENNGFTQTNFEANNAKGLNLGCVFYNLGGIIGDEYTLEELKEAGVSVDENGVPYTDVNKFTSSTVDKFLKSKLGLELSKIEYKGGLQYSEKYDAFYDQHGDTSYCKVEVDSYAEKNGNIYTIKGRYGDSLMSEAFFEMKLEKTGSDYRFISNTITGKTYFE